MVIPPLHQLSATLRDDVYCAVVEHYVRHVSLSLRVEALVDAQRSTREDGIFCARTSPGWGASSAKIRITD
jgi:hypothetical protein